MRHHSQLEKNRIEAFTDGVLAIIITIMVLEFKQPVGDLWGDFFALWPSLLAYLVSFLLIAIFWVNHHILFHGTNKINVAIAWTNIAWLFFMSFIPFLTVWIGDYPNSYAPICIYYLDILFAGITFHLMFYLIMRRNGEKFKLGASNIISLIVYLLAALLGGFCPPAAFIAVILVSCWWMFSNNKKKNLDKEEKNGKSE